MVVAAAVVVAAVMEVAAARREVAAAPRAVHSAANAAAAVLKAAVAAVLGERGTHAVCLPKLQLLRIAATCCHPLLRATNQPQNRGNTRRIGRRTRQRQRRLPMQLSSTTTHGHTEQGASPPRTVAHPSQCPSGARNGASAGTWHVGMRKHEAAPIDQAGPCGQVAAPR